LSLRQALLVEAGRYPAGEGTVTVARTDTEHLAERLGLFAIIVLGEGVIQLVEAGSEAGWDEHFFAVMRNTSTAGSRSRRPGRWYPRRAPTSSSPPR
jgi:low temperature requirement protein LtrA